MEVCPFCGGQLISCRCCYRKLRIDCSEGGKGLTAQWEAVWDQKLEGKGLIPWIQWPLICPCCGELYPKMFFLKDEEWEAVVPPELRSAVLCRHCFNRLAAREKLPAPPRCQRCGQAGTTLTEVTEPWGMNWWGKTKSVCPDCLKFLRHLLKEGANARKLIC